MNFDWSAGSPDPSLAADHFSARWTGQVQATTSGNYVFSTVSDDGVRLWINGAQVINHWTDHSTTTDTSGPIALTAGQKVDIKMEYYENTGGAVAKLYWTPPGLVSAPIPQSQLYPAGLVSGAVYRVEPQCAPGKCLDVTGVSTAPGANVQIWAWWGGANQQWAAISDGNGVWEFAPQHSNGTRLDDIAFGTADGTNVQQWTANGSSAQQWRVYENGDGTFGLEPLCAAGKRLDVNQSGTSDGTNVQISTSNGGNAQRWKFYRQ